MLKPIAAACLLILATPSLASVPSDLDSLRARYPGAIAENDAAGLPILLANLATEPLGTSQAEAAIAFVQRYPGLFGIDGRVRLTIERGAVEGGSGAVRLGRELFGQPIFGGEIVVSLSADHRAMMVAMGGLPENRPSPASLDASAAAERDARQWAGMVVAGTPKAGFLALNGNLRPVIEYWVSLASDMREVILDGETGAVLGSRTLNIDATANLYAQSPSTTPTGHCTASLVTDYFGPEYVYDRCAPTVSTTLGNLTSATKLIGTNTTIYNCNGQTYGGFTGTCNSSSATQGATASGGAFNYTPDATGTSTSDIFAEVMGYYGVDSQAAYFKTIGSGAFVSGGGVGQVPGFVNAYDSSSGGPLDNAFFTSGCAAMLGSPCMVFGQATTVDGAYDTDVVFHEMTHAAVSATAHFGGNASGANGLVSDAPPALNEGTADTFSVARSGDSVMGEYFASDTLQISGPDGGPVPLIIGPRGYIRDVGQFKTCRGDGRVEPFGGRANSGLDGEAHDDGEIWGDFMWELRQGLKGVNALSVAGGQTAPTCSPSEPGCNAGDVAAFRALEGMGSSPTYSSYATAVVNMVGTLYGSAAKTYAQCVMTRHDLANCDQTVDIYAGDAKFGYFYKGTGSSHLPGVEVVAQADGTTDLKINACTAYGNGVLYIKKGTTSPSGPIPANSVPPTFYDWSVPIKTRMSPCWGNANTNGKKYQTTITITAAGTCTYSGWDTSNVANDANPPVVSGNCTKKTGSANAAGPWYVLNQNTTPAANITSGGQPLPAGSLFSGFWNVANAGIAARPTTPPQDCSSLMPSGGTCTPVCEGVPCGSANGCGANCVGGSGCIVAGPDAGVCQPTCAGLPCGNGDGCGGTCGAGSGCVGTCTPVCSGKTCGAADGCGGTCTAGSGCCTPSCAGKNCGASDGCGGTCTAGSGCCTPVCTGKVCGASDGCTGTCTAGSGCCTPVCSGKTCGAADGCGGTCAAGSGCCTPVCSGKTCGASDGCGGTCTAGSGCCSPSCSGKTCGAADGCGGTCTVGSGCNPADGGCAPVCSGKLCGDADGCGGTCAAGSGCCTPACSGKLCGDSNGCGGTCAAGSGCCTPVCSGKTCGDTDGCGGTCTAGSGCCVPVCTGVICGQANGCGGTCQTGSGCTPPADGGCVANCNGKACGTGDGCGGLCQPGSGCTTSGDGGTTADGGSTADGGVTPDGGTNADGGPKPDAGKADGGLVCGAGTHQSGGTCVADGGGGGSSGCGCSTGADAMFGLLGIGALLRRRRR